MYKPISGIDERYSEKPLSIDEYAKSIVQKYQGQYNETELARMLGIGRSSVSVNVS